MKVYMLLCRWYTKDENAVPDAYILQPISTHYPDYIQKNDKEAFKKARGNWWTENTIMHQTMRSVAQTLSNNGDLSHRIQRSGIVENNT